MQFVWQAALTDTAAYLDQAHELTPVAIGGWSPVTMDPPTMRLSMRRHHRSINISSIISAHATMAVDCRDDRCLVWYSLCHGRVGLLSVLLWPVLAE